ncbi:hypothetical protein [Nocardia araoensis]|uniref:hypothetical protein n=1 Tax=Nocardia araoensis TaxID=228600 RepID=UPI0002D5949A|nr:hypothetical protein [Nocardia araoensis]
MLATGFGPGINGPLPLAAELHTPADHTTLTALADTVKTIPGVAGVTPPALNPAGSTALIQIIPATAPQDRATMA